MDDFYIGQEVSVEKTFGKDEVLAFSELTGDCNPLHIDDGFAKNSRFGATIVHGMFVAGLISKVIGMQLPGEGSIYLEQNMRFLKPVYVGDCVTAKVKIKDIMQEKKIFTLETNVYGNDGTCFVSGTAKVLYEGEL
ncbi:MaoC family dehydratase [Lachnospiraceae bacterium JLR.KK009]|jgi:Acyl dehydratase|nr:hypothetical protein C810_03346 [Lachnospiraceae bacterium A2]